MLPEAVHDAPDGYQNLVRIDQGGSAVVYRGLDIRFDRTVALKILQSDSLVERQQLRFNAECLATGRVSAHPNIVTVYDAGTTRGHRRWLAMEYCSGGSLAQKVARQGPLPVAEVILIGGRLCDALGAAHEAGILHRDVKPHNVLLTSYGEPALADFGIASVSLVDDSASATTGASAAYTVVHAAPEILEGELGTVAADIYSLGSTLYTLLAGQAPFAKAAGTGLAPLVTRILAGDVPAITRRDVPPEFEKLLRRCLATKPADRPVSAAELGASLTELGAGLTELAETGQQLDTDEKPVSTRRLLVTLCGALGVLLVVFMALGLGGGSPGSGPERIQPHLARNVVAARAAPPTADEYAPKGLTVATGRSEGELIVTWRMPIRPDVVATVIYEGAGRARAARAVVNYNRSPKGVPHATATLHALPASRRVCLSAAHVVSIDDVITHAVSRPECAVPR